MTEGNGRPIRGNTISGGTGNAGTAGFPSIAVNIGLSASVDLVGNTIDAGSGSGGSAGSYGVTVAETATVLLRGNRIFGGSPSSAAGPTFVVGVVVWSSGGIRIIGNMIHAGSNQHYPDMGTIAIQLERVDAPVVQHNTLFSGRSSPTRFGIAVELWPGVTGSIIENNLALSDDGTSDRFLSLKRCAAEGPIRRISNNARTGFCGGSTGRSCAMTYDSVAAPCAAFAEFGGSGGTNDFEVELASRCTPTTPGACQSFGGVQATSNVQILDDCSGLSKCVQLAGCNPMTPMACATAIFETWNAADFGLAALWDPGWRLKASLPCALTQGGLDLGIATDLFGAPRTPPPSLGAHEQNVACTP
jgi:hypothetical protein